jgi:hypothetical protein
VGKAVASIQQIKDDADAWYDANIAALEAFQATYFAENGKYLQLLDSHSIRPDDGIGQNPDQLDMMPPQVLKGWRDIPVDFSGMKFSLACHEYVGPLGSGHWYEMAFTKANQAHRRCHNIGPDTQFEVPWHQVLKPEDRI